MFILHDLLNVVKSRNDDDENDLKGKEERKNRKG
jgi:hypothetical protein